jgi:uncharacterized membrane protein
VGIEKELAKGMQWNDHSFYLSTLVWLTMQWCPFLCLVCKIYLNCIGKNIQFLATKYLPIAQDM